MIRLNDIFRAILEMFLGCKRFLEMAYEYKEYIS